MKFPDKLDVLTVHARLIAETGGSGGLATMDASAGFSLRAGCALSIAVRRLVPELSTTTGVGAGDEARGGSSGACAGTKARGGVVGVGVGAGVETRGGIIDATAGAEVRSE